MTAPVFAGQPVAPGWDCHVHVFDASAPVAAGHYQPVSHPLADIERLAQAHGVGHLVLVQPSVYGTDNTVLLQALGASPGRHRAVAVVDAGVDDATLQAMHAQGVRGVRFNLVSPVGNDAHDFAVLAPRLRALGWHAQWYASPEDLTQVLRWHQGSGVTCVLDHLAGLHADVPAAHPAWGALAALAEQGAWVKLSGWYRLRAAPPYGAVLANLLRVARLFGEHLVWGSDWPHTAFAAGSLPTYASQWAPVSSALPAQATLQLRTVAAETLYA